MTPKVLISHAGEDKDRVVIEFVTMLRENGIDTMGNNLDLHSSHVQRDYFHGWRL